MLLPQPTHTHEQCEAVSLYIAEGLSCPMCKAHWILFPDYYQMDHKENCSYITSADYHDVVQQAVDAVMAASA